MLPAYLLGRNDDPTPQEAERNVNLYCVVHLVHMLGFEVNVTIQGLSGIIFLFYVQICLT